MDLSRAITQKKSERGSRSQRIAAETGIELLPGVLPWVLKEVVELENDHPGLGPTQYAFPTIKPSEQFELARDGFTPTNRLEVIDSCRQICAQVSPFTATRHLPHFKVVPSAAVALAGGATREFVYPVLSSGARVTPGIEAVAVYVPP